MNGQKEKLIEATARLLSSRGLARITTRDIAREAQVAEGALYHHFGDKAELIVEVALQSVGDFREVLDSLPLQVGQATVEQNLERVLYSAYSLHYKIAPLFCSLFADRELLERIRGIMNERCVGPGRDASLLAAYLNAEQRLGRVAADAQSEGMAELMLSACFNAALKDNFYGVAPDDEELRRRTREKVRALVLGLRPETTAETEKKAATRAPRKDKR
jgi:AcrR family transcriptional regulator